MAKSKDLADKVVESAKDEVKSASKKPYLPKVINKVLQISPLTADETNLWLDSYYKQGYELFDTHYVGMEQGVITVLYILVRTS